MTENRKAGRRRAGSGLFPGMVLPVYFLLIFLIAVLTSTTALAASASTETESTAAEEADSSNAQESQAEVQETSLLPPAPTVPKPEKPGVPVLKISSHSSRAYLTWGKTSHASQYYVYRRLSGKKGYTRIAKTSKTKYTDKSVKAGRSYVYKVRAVNIDQGQTVKGSASHTVKVLISAIRPKKKMIALTFDDGPGPYTKSIVNCLKKYGMHATFFVVGNRAGSYKSALKAASRAGCEIGNHSWDHADLSSRSPSQIRSQISRTNKQIKAITGKKPVLMRPPYGSVNSRVRKNVKMPLIYWSVDTLDWKTRSKSATVSSVMKHAKDGQIILMHDIHTPTRAAALTLIPKLVKKGYQLVTVSELAKYKGKKLKKGTVYYSIR